MIITGDNRLNFGQMNSALLQLIQNDPLFFAALADFGILVRLLWLHLAAEMDQL